MKKVAIYTRVSTEEQKEGYSLSAQKDMLIKLCESKGWEWNIYEDPGLSGKDTKRPALRKLISDVENKKVNIVLVYKVDRISRSMIDLANMLNIFETYGVAFKSATEAFDTTTPAGRAMLNMLGTFAQFERESISERVKMGMRKKAMVGKFQGIAPYGYKLDLGNLVIHDSEAETVCLIFELYVEENYGARQIANYLNTNGKTARNSNKWHFTVINSIVSNPIYKGYIRWGKYDYSIRGLYRRKKKDDEWIYAKGVHKPIVSEDIWDKAQSIKESRRSYRRGETGDYLLVGLIFCGRCGSRMYGKSAGDKKGKWRGYRCGGRHNFGNNYCDMKSINADNLEDTVISEIVKAIRNPEWIREATERANEKLKLERIRVENDIRYKEIHIQQLKNTLERYFLLFEKQELDIEVFKERVKAVKEEIEKRNIELELLKAQKIDFDLEELSIIHFSDALLEFDEAVKNSDRQNLKRLLKSTIEKVVILSDGEVELHILADSSRRWSDTYAWGG